MNAVVRTIRTVLHSSHIHAQLMQGASAILGMVTFLCFARWMSVEEVGVLVLFITAITLLDMLRSGFFQPAFVRFVNGATAPEKQTVRGSALLLGLGWSIVTAVLVGIVGSVWTLNESFPNGTMVSLAWPILIVTTFPGQYFTWKAQAESRFDRILIYRILNSLSALVAIVVLHVLGRLSPTSIAFIFGGAGALSSLFVISRRWVQLGDLRHASLDVMQQIARFGRYAMTTSLGASLLRSSDTFLIGAFLDARAVAVYGLAQKAVEVLDLPLRALSASVYPKMTSGPAAMNGRRIGRIIERVTGGYLLLIAIPATLMIVFTTPLIQLVAGPEWLGAVPVIRIFVIAAMLMPLDRMIGIGLDSLGRPQVNMTKVLAMLASNVVGDIWMLQWFGTLESVALVTIGMNGVGVLMGYLVIQPEARLSVSRMLSVSKHWFSPSYIRMTMSRSAVVRSSDAG